jgi:adenylate cyclase, class 2
VVETEIKIAWARSAAEAVAFLESHGYQCSRPRELESDTLYDRDAGAGQRELQQRRQALRLRRTPTRALITFKGSPQEGPHKVREEIEFEASSGEAAELMFTRLGYQPRFRYQKYRSTYRKPDAPGIVTLDETPIGVFLELEGPAEWIDSTAASLGFTRAQYVTASYAGLYYEYRQGNPQAPVDMIFSI